MFFFHFFGIHSVGQFLCGISPSYAAVPFSSTNSFICTAQLIHFVACVICFVLFQTALWIVCDKLSYFVSKCPLGFKLNLRATPFWSFCVKYFHSVVLIIKLARVSFLKMVSISELLLMIRVWTKIFNFCKNLSHELWKSLGNLYFTLKNIPYEFLIHSLVSFSFLLHLLCKFFEFVSLYLFPW